MLDAGDKIINKRHTASALMKQTCGGYSNKIIANSNIKLPLVSEAMRINKGVQESAALARSSQGNVPKGSDPKGECLRISRKQAS